MVHHPGLRSKAPVDKGTTAPAQLMGLGRGSFQGCLQRLLKGIYKVGLGCRGCGLVLLGFRVQGQGGFGLVVSNGALHQKLEIVSTRGPGQKRFRV